MLPEGKKKSEDVQMETKDLADPVLRRVLWDGMAETLRRNIPTQLQVDLLVEREIMAAIRSEGSETGLPG